MQDKAENLILHLFFMKICFENVTFPPGLDLFLLLPYNCTEYPLIGAKL